jgi:hypothetical protein
MPARRSTAESGGFGPESSPSNPTEGARVANRCQAEGCLPCAAKSVRWRTLGPVSNKRSSSSFVASCASRACVLPVRLDAGMSRVWLFPTSVGMYELPYMPAPRNSLAMARMHLQIRVSLNQGRDYRPAGTRGFATFAVRFLTLCRCLHAWCHWGVRLGRLQGDFTVRDLGRCPGEEVAGPPVAPTVLPRWRNASNSARQPWREPARFTGPR